MLAHTLSLAHGLRWTKLGHLASVSQSITVEDKAPPTLVGVPSNTPVECNVVPTPAAVTASDTVIPIPSSHWRKPRPGFRSESLRTLQITITRTWAAADACHNSATATQLIAVVDTSAPTITSAPANRTVSCPSEVPAANDALVVASDNSAGAVGSPMMRMW